LGYTKYTFHDATVISGILWLLYFTDFKEKLLIEVRTVRIYSRPPRTHLVDERKYTFKSKWKNGFKAEQYRHLHLGIGSANHF
jgi:hypothetical protein